MFEPAKFKKENKMNTKKAEDFVSQLGECCDGVGGMQGRVPTPPVKRTETNSRCRFTVSYREGDSEKTMSVRASTPAQAVEAVKSAHPSADILGVD